MPISNTVENQLNVMGFNSSLWVPQHEPYPHIITQSRFGTLALLGTEDVDPKAQYDKTKMINVPALIKSAPSNSVKNEIEQYITHPMVFTVNGALSGWAAGSSKNVTLDSTGGLKAYDVLRDKATGSEVIIVSVTSSTVVVCRPFTGGVSAAGTDNMADDATLELVGSAWKDGATFGDGIRSTPETDYNYMDIMVDEYGIGMFQQEVDMFPGANKTAQLETERTLARVRHNQKRELRMLFGSRVANTTVDSNATIYGAAGLYGFSSRRINAGGSVTLDEWNTDIMPAVTQFGGGDFRAMCGSTVLAVWAKLAKDQIRITNAEKMYGNRVMTVQSTVEQITLHGTEPMNRRDGEMLMFQPELLQRRYFPKFNSIHVENIHASNTAKRVNGFVTVECVLPRNKDSIVVVEGVLA